MIVMVSIFFMFAMFVLAALLIKAIEKRLNFVSILFLHALIVISLVAAGMDGFVMVFAVLDVIFALYLKQKEGVN